MLRDEHARILAAGLGLVGISPQGADSHARFRAKHELPFPLLADAQKRTIRAWGVDGPFGAGVRRATFHVGADGIVLGALRADFRIERHRDFVAGVIQEVRRTMRS